MHIIHIHYFLKVKTTTYYLFLTRLLYYQETYQVHTVLNKL